MAKEIDKKVFAQISKLNIKIVKLDFKKAQAMATGKNHQGYLLKIEHPKLMSLKDLKIMDFLLVLVGITDIGNIGAIMRSAFALGVDGVVVSGLKTLSLPGIVRSSSGSSLDMPIAHVEDPISVVNELRQVGYTIYATDINGEDIRYIEFTKGKKAVLLGSEGSGLSNRLLNMSDNKLKIVMKRDFDSLNVSAATAIICDRMIDR